MRAFFGLLFGVLLIALIASGCGPHLTEDELGTVIFDAQQLPGMDKPYELPESAAEPAAKSESGSAEAS